MTRKRYTGLVRMVALEMKKYACLTRKEKRAMNLTIYKWQAQPVAGKSYDELFDIFREWTKQNTNARV